ncbi:MAG: hypothetical protein Q9219_005001 [cf. Caloplaca sp. 3 TL-2023]
MPSVLQYFTFLVIPTTVWLAQGRVVPRDGPHTYEIPGGTIFAPDWATCANDDSVKGPFGSTSALSVRPSCDTVINIVCRVAVDDYSKGRQMRNLVASSDGENPCQASILFSQPKLADTFDYEGCVKDFQKITTACMLLGDDNAKYAANAQQAGVMNVEYTAEGGASNTAYPKMKASDRFNYKPGYMVGPPNYFGGVGYGTDVTGTFG